MSTARHGALARIAARFGKMSRLAIASAAVTATAVGVGIAAAQPEGIEPGPSQLTSSAGAAISAVDLDELAASREQRASRTAPRVTLEPQPLGHKFATAPLNIWTQPREQGRRLGLVKWGTKLPVTGQVVGHWAEVLLKDGRTDVIRWVNADYLANKKPKPERASGGAATGGLSSAPCPDGSDIESGLTDAADRVYRAVCAAFPEPTTYGGYDPHGEHVDGRAIDIMISGDVGYQIAEWLRANASALGIRDIIYAQRIWTPDRSSEGWRSMSDRGSTTANHYDHVHVAVY